MADDCTNCRFFEPHIAPIHKEIGECRRYPPQLVAVVRSLDAGVTFTPIDTALKCGEWKVLQP